MNAVMIQQNIELFHLLFLSFLGKKLDKRRYALKGGCNLRFFFGSPRYSEDMDLDVADAPVHALRDIVNGLLASAPFRQALQTADLEIEHVTEHKQTATTQRWKFGLRLMRSVRPAPTRIEFSRRGLRGAVVLGAAAPALVQRYGLAPVLIPHYDGETALRQKIEALAGRRVTQARDIFDLHLLLSEERMREARSHLAPAVIVRARDRALDLSYDDFKGQVVAFLDAADQDGYDSPRVWETIQLRVLEILEAAP